MDERKGMLSLLNVKIGVQHSTYPLKIRHPLNGVSYVHISPAQALQHHQKR